MISLRHFFSTFSWATLFDLSIRALLIFLPFSAFVTVFFTYKLGIHGTSFIKEGLMVLALVTLICQVIMQQTYILKFTKIDILILIYIAVMVLISIGTTGIRGIIYGGRYDFAFLISYLIAYHGYPLLQKPLSYYLRIFLYAAGVMLVISALLKWPLHEDILLYFGYSGNPSVWDFGGAPPIFQGIDGANVRRFQGLLDGPNTMGAFLILFSGIFAYFTRLYREWHFIIACILIGLVGMVIYTYSRSALIGIVVAYMIVLVMSISVLWNLYRGQLIAVFVILAFLTGSIAILFSGRAMAIIGRAGSTSGHSERMTTGIHRSMEHPIGQGLGSAGPAYRYVQSLSGEDHTRTEELDRYYIPESWYIQQFVEGGFLGGVLFILIMIMIFFQLLSIHPIIGAMFAGIGVMNLFLHTFESSIVSLSLFLLVGLLIAHRHHAKK